MTNDFFLVGRSDLESFTAGILNFFATRVPVSGGEILGLRSENAGSRYGGVPGDNVLEWPAVIPLPARPGALLGPRSQKPSSTSPPSSKPTRTATASAMRPRISARPTPPPRDPAQAPLPRGPRSKPPRSRSARRSSRARKRQRSARSASRRLRSSGSRRSGAAPERPAPKAGFVVVGLGTRSLTSAKIDVNPRESTAIRISGWVPGFVPLSTAVSVHLEDPSAGACHGEGRGFESHQPLVIRLCARSRRPRQRAIPERSAAPLQARRARLEPSIPNRLVAVW